MSLYIPKMKNRFLFIGDRFWGIEPSVGDILADFLLVEYPALPFEFSIQSSARNTFEALFLNCPRDIIGRKAGTTLLSLGWEDCLGSLPLEQCVEGYRKLLHEIQRNSQTSIYVMTHPVFQLDSNSPQFAKLSAIAHFLRESAREFGCILFDMDKTFRTYQQSQIVRGELARNLFTDSGTLGQLGKMLCAQTLAKEFTLSL